MTVVPCKAIYQTKEPSGVFCPSRRLFVWYLPTYKETSSISSHTRLPKTILEGSARSSRSPQTASSSCLRQTYTQSSILYSQTLPRPSWTTIQQPTSPSQPQKQPCIKNEMHEKIIGSITGAETPETGEPSQPASMTAS